MVEGALPPDLRIAIALSGPLNDHATVGALLQGKVVGEVAQKGKVLVYASRAAEAVAGRFAARGRRWGARGPRDRGVGGRAADRCPNRS